MRPLCPGLVSLARCSFFAATLFSSFLAPILIPSCILLSMRSSIRSL